MNRPQYKFSEVGSWFRNKFNAIVAQNLFEIGLNNPALPIFLPGLDVKTDRIAVHVWPLSKLDVPGLQQRVP
jgi:hypothetical protein